MLRAATGFPELTGFFTETTPGVYQSRGGQLPVNASPLGVSLGGLRLHHKGGADVAPRGSSRTGGIVNTYIGDYSSSGLPAFQVVDYPDIYPGVCLRLSFQGRTVKADYIVAPGADPRVIRFRYEGEKARLDGNDLVAGNLRQPAPTVLQGKQELSAAYEIEAGDWVRFVISPHDPALPLVIDPYVISKSGYFGGVMADQITAMAVDGSGYIYAAGRTESTEFPAGSLRTHGGGAEAFVLKIHPETLQVAYATYLGGAAEDRALALAVDASGSVYVAGLTASPDFPAQPAYGGDTDGFVARLTPAGALQFATFLGGSGLDSANGIALKADGSAWVVGDTNSTNLTIRGTPFRSVNQGAQDAFLARVNGDGSVAYMGYFGGSGDDRAVALNSTGEVYFTGGTASGNFPTANAYRLTNSGMQDAFAAKLSADGATLRYSTYLGGSGGAPGNGETGNWIGVDSTGAATIVGTTGSPDFPLAGSAMQASFGGGATDAFVAKFSNSGLSLLYSSFFGGAGSDEGTRGALASGAFYFGGNTSSQGMSTVDAVQSAHGGSMDGFLVKLSSNLSTIQSFSFLGYTGIDSLSGLAVTPSSIVLAGSSSSSAWLPSGGFKGYYDGWVMVLTEPPLAIQMTSTPAGIPFTVSGSGCSPGTGTTPAALSWITGASCTVASTRHKAQDQPGMCFSDGQTVHRRIRERSWPARRRRRIKLHMERSISLRALLRRRPRVG